MLGGMLLLALAWTVRSVLHFEPAQVMPPRLRWMAWAGFVMLAAQIVVGALVSTRHAALACTTFPDCQGVLWPPLLDWRVFDPLQSLTGAAADVALQLRQSLHLVHRWGALLAIAGAALLTIAACKAGGALHAQGVWLAVLVLAQCALGIALVVVSPQLALTVAHDLLAALLLAVALAIACSLKS
jgi:cytochrome c oxidase assembly protein subunit 15